MLNGFFFLFGLKVGCMLLNDMSVVSVVSTSLPYCSGDKFGCLHWLSAEAAICIILSSGSGSHLVLYIFISFRRGTLIMSGRNDIIAVFMHASWNGMFV